MSAIEVTLNPTFKRTRKSAEARAAEPTEQLFRVVVNNYKQQHRPYAEKKPEFEEARGPKKGLPPQPERYLKYPDYDWF